MDPGTVSMRVALRYDLLRFIPGSPYLFDPFGSDAFALANRVHVCGLEFLLCFAGRGSFENNEEEQGSFDRLLIFRL